MMFASLGMMFASQFSQGWVGDRSPPPGAAHIKAHSLLHAESTATAAISYAAISKGLPPLQHPAPPLERSLGPLLSNLRCRATANMSDSQRRHNFRGVSTRWLSHSSDTVLLAARMVLLLYTTSLTPIQLIPVHTHTGGPVLAT